ncbi:MAG: diguanylate cyclase [Candidatus Accumulibacter sp.]|nr:diguanylate cyclase [Accumulibacter sp.]
MVAGKRRVLVVDGSRVVRTTLAKRLESGFNVVEEDNGESAWQRLMLDGSIVAVISSPNPPRLAAEDLLGRMRSTALRRLRKTPLILLVSDDHPDGDERQSPEADGFMTKSMSREAMTECLERVLSGAKESREEEGGKIPHGSHEAQGEKEAREEAPHEGEAQEEAPEKEPEKEPEKVPEKVPEQTRASRTISLVPLLGVSDFRAAVATLPHEVSSDESLCVLVFGIDRLDELTSRFGSDVPDLLTGKIARLLAAKIDPRDVLGQCGKDCVAIVSHGVDLRSGVGFGRRVCKSMATGQIAVHGRKIRLTVSVGVAATSEDRVDSPEELLVLAQKRLKQAVICGGNSVCTELRPDCSLHQRDEALVSLFRLLGEMLEAEQKSALGTAAQPLLRRIDARLSLDVKTALGLSITDIDPTIGFAEDESD